jgi:hypothetical protein
VREDDTVTLALFAKVVIGLLIVLVVLDFIGTDPRQDSSWWDDGDV